MLNMSLVKGFILSSVSALIVSGALASVSVSHGKKEDSNSPNVILVNKDLVSHTKNVSVTDGSYDMKRGDGNSHDTIDGQVLKPEEVSKKRFDSIGKVYIPKSFEEASRLSELKYGIKKNKISTVNSSNVVKGVDISSLPVKNEEGISFLASVIYHSDGKSDLTKDDLRSITEVSKFVKEKSARVLVVGHASSRTADMSMLNHKLVNYDISMKRASKIKDELVRNGLSPQIISLSAVSDTEPIQNEVMPMSESVNRRSEIYISY